MNRRIKKLEGQRYNYLRNNRKNKKGLLEIGKIKSLKIKMIKLMKSTLSILENLDKFLKKKGSLEDLKIGLMIRSLIRVCVQT